MTGKPQPKIVRLPSMGGSGKQAISLVPGAGEAKVVYRGTLKL